MNTVDIILVICFIPALVKGISKGFIMQVVAIISLFLSVFAARHFSEPVAQWMKTWMSLEDGIINIISFVCIALVTIIVMNILGKIITKIIKLTMMDWLDKLLGVILSVLFTSMALGFAITLFEAINNSLNIVRSDILDTSLLYGRIRDFASVIFPYLKDIFSNV